MQKEPKISSLIRALRPKLKEKQLEVLIDQWNLGKQMAVKSKNAIMGSRDYP